MSTFVSPDSIETPRQKCSARDCPFDCATGSTFCLAHAASPPATADTSKITRNADFQTGAHTKHLRLPAGLPKGK